MSKLRAAQASLDRGNGHAAIDQLRAFIHEVHALENGGRLDRATADSLIAEAMQIIGEVTAQAFPGSRHGRFPGRPGDDRDE
jgi:FIMAH domain-containing protein